jgi:hypothetical protein
MSGQDAVDKARLDCSGGRLPAEHQLNIDPDTSGIPTPAALETSITKSTKGCASMGAGPVTSVA